MVVFNFTQKGAKFTDDTYTVSTSRLYIHLSHLSSPHTHTHIHDSAKRPLSWCYVCGRENLAKGHLWGTYIKNPPGSNAQGCGGGSR
ncbi:hypothetical protein COCCADRAFT_85645 [Bipolaris zeicola 26-R-13]|uniref:Uncharacterized protein n=1 Tax=Cochliobolus carbonum (strain 26-R-13) TaxID=930089 RepID=W6YI80_COCC2|nr:uncharacterized protein COCCADRAFT_85645 [Bipolaris zeicola 26-R-13]EUC37383.1 hypothetical protein COCCADRAFT_85645 [Bipolaris zeicola 26-R-13]